VSRVIVIEFVSLDGVMHDPDGSEGSRQGGWAFRYGPEAVAGDPFRLGEVLDAGALLLGRRTWELFAGIWPGRDDPFSAKMNAMPKLVASRSLEQAAGWQNSAVLHGDLATEAGKRKQEQDILVMGSASVVRVLMAHDLVAVGVNVDCAPVLDVPEPGAHDIIGDRAYASDPATVAMLGRAACEGFQAAGITPIVKHCPGHGRAMVDSHLSVPVVEARRRLALLYDTNPFV